MRAWGNLTSEEKELFIRTCKGISDLEPNERFEVETLKVEMFCRPLSKNEVERFTFILDDAESLRILERSAA